MKNKSDSTLEKTTSVAAKTDTKKLKSNKSDVSKFTQQSTKKEGVKNPVGRTISPIQIGSTIVGVFDSSQVDDVRNAFEELVLKKSKRLGIPMPDINTLLSVHSGNARQLELANAMVYANAAIDTEVEHEFKEIVSGDVIDWVSDAGRYILQPIIKESEGMVTLVQKISGPVTPAISNSLFYIRDAAKKAGVCVVIFLTCSEKHEKSHLNELCDDYIEVEACEPDMGCEAAFSFDCVALRTLNSLGVGKTMCNVIKSKGEFRRRYSSFISNCLETRVMWILRGHKKGLDEIGKIFKKDKSTVHRRLSGLPTPKYIDMPKGWLERYLESKPATKYDTGSIVDDNGDDSEEVSG